jgi:hypothetical protein
VRVKNNYQSAFTKISIGAAVFSDVEPGGITVYQHISDGEQPVRGECPPLGTLAGKLSFSGEGHHQWTVVIGASGYLTMMEDTES